MPLPDASGPPVFPSRSVRTARLAGALCAALGAIVLIGWGIGNESIKAVLPGAVSMKANTALAFLAAGLSLWLESGRHAAGRRAIAGGLATLVLLIAILTLTEYLLGMNLGIDELLSPDRIGAHLVYPGRMSPFSAVGFLATGLGLLLLPGRGWQWASGAAGTVVVAIGSVAILGYAWSATELTGAEFVPPMAIHTGAAFLVLGAGLLVASSAIYRSTAAEVHNAIALDRPIIGAWFVAFLVVVVVGGVAYRVTARAATAATAAARNQQLQILLGQLGGALSDAESSQRAYLLTGVAPLRERYEQKAAEVQASLSKLDARLTDDPEQVRRFGLLAALSTTRMGLLDLHVRIYEQQGLPAAQEAIRASDGVPLMRAADSVIRSIVHESEVRLSGHRVDATLAQQRTLVGLIGMVVVATVGFFLLFVFVRRLALRRESAEQALRASEENLMVTLRSIGDGVLVTDAEGRITSLNVVGEQLTGWPEREAIGRPARDVFDLRERDGTTPAYVPVDDVLRLGVIRSLTDDNLLVARNGRMRDVADSCAPIHDREGRVIGAVLVFRDVSAEREASRAIAAQQERLTELNASLEQRVQERTQALHESEQRFANLFESAPDAMLVLSPGGEVVLANRHAQELFGRPRGALIGRTLDQLVPSIDPLRDVGDRRRYLSRADGQHPNEPGRQLLARRADGTEVPVEVLVSPIATPSGPALTAAIRDISDRVHLEEQFRQAQRMETVGLLAGGIAHDFNNLLSVINNTADLAAGELGEDDPLRGELAAIHDAGLRAAALTRQLLAFSRRTVTQPQVIDLGAVIAEMQPMLSRLLGEHIAITCRRDAGPAFVRIDPAQLEQVILNLGINSRDAMPEGGSLTIETGPVHVNGTYVERHPDMASGDYVLLAVTDTGQGMDAATREHIFEPFFTTKPAGKGTGLGLSTAYGIIKQAGGAIWVYSESGRGTIMKIFLPAAAPSDTPRPTDTPSTARRGHDGRTILVVEDEVALQRVVRRILESAGYRVLVATSGEEALRHLDGARTIHLLLTDVVMPGMSGRELAEAALERRPGLPVLFTSGYTEDTIVRHGVLEEGFGFIAKPYTVEELTRKVGEMFAQGAEDGEG